MHLNSVPARWGSDPCLLHTLYFWLSGQRRYQAGKEPVCFVHLLKKIVVLSFGHEDFGCPFTNQKCRQDHAGQFPAFRYSNLIFSLLLSEECSSSSIFLVWFLSVILLILKWYNASFCDFTYCHFCEVGSLFSWSSHSLKCILSWWKH